MRGSDPDAVFIILKCLCRRDPKSKKNYDLHPKMWGMLTPMHWLCNGIHAVHMIGMPEAQIILVPGGIW